MDRNRKEPWCFFGCTFIARRVVRTLALGKNVENSPYTFSDKEVAILRPGQLVRTHRAALHERVWLGNVVEIRETALRTFARERVDRGVEHVAAIHAVVGGGDFNASHGRTLMAITNCDLSVCPEANG
ncbi:MAG: hypothetical protein JWM11_2703 [Planctomycetaceae bacterium]|nr:hypothetical protein [Planctomycetaceae bacterium]